MTAKLCNLIPEWFDSPDNNDRIFSEEEKMRFKIAYQPREQPILGRPGESCKTNLFFGFFFDGTKNNYALAEEQKTHSNVARLYDCYPGLSVPDVLPKETDWTYNADRYTHFFKVYVPGVASPFEHVLDTGKGIDYTLGAGIGNKGEARIVWALIQAINNVHRYFKRTPLISAEEVRSLLGRLALDRTKLSEMRPGGWFDSLRKRDEKDRKTRAEFEDILQRLHNAISQHWFDKLLGRPAKIDPGIVEKIHISIFGFSRGATQARAFSNWLIALCKLDALLRGKGDVMTLGGFDVTLDFIGLFDTVASVGTANTFGNQWGMGALDGHAAWADAEESLRIPEGVRCLHLVGAHEVRRSFPLDSIAVRSVLGEKSKEIVMPGVHSDIGGGYAPTEQGKGTDAAGNDMLSRIPLVYMYREARLAGVPLKLELARNEVKERFRIAPSTIKAFNDYISTCKTKVGSLTDIMREQRRYYIQWRLLRRASGNTPLETTESFNHATEFDRNDLHSANLEFEAEVGEYERWLAEKGANFQPKHQDPGFDDMHEKEWEHIASWWKSAASLAPAAIRFFDDYVHDSRAWFKLFPGNPDSEDDMHVKLGEWVAALRRARAKNVLVDRRAEALEQTQKTRPVHVYGMRKPPRQYVPDGLTSAQRQAAEEYERTNKIPRMLTEGREPFTSAKAGYLRYRKIYAGGDRFIMAQQLPEARDDKEIADA